MVTEEQNAAQLSQDKQIAKTMWVLLLTLIGNLLRTNAVWTVPPLSFLSLISDSHSMRAASVERLRIEWESLEVLEKTALVDSEAASFLQSLLIPRMHFVRATFVRLMEGAGSRMCLSS